jgi:hypothetical protein
VLSGIKHHVRYWGFLLLKLVAAASGSVFALWFLNLFWEPYNTKLFHLNQWQFSYDLLYTSLVGVWFLFSYGLFYLAVWDQKYRCRTCLRRLRMPLETGSWSYMLQLGRPKIEYICPYGHGKLNIEEVQISGTVPPAWTDHGDMWEELFAVSKESDREF